MVYEMRELVMDGFDPPYPMVAYTPEGAYIGDEEWAKKLSERGIAPMLRTEDSNVCSIGWCEAEQKWYGWSHRAIHGFGIGAKVDKGDCAYTADTVDGLIEEYVAFFADVADPAETRALLKPDYENNRLWIGEKHYPVQMVQLDPEAIAEAVTSPDVQPNDVLTMGGYWKYTGRGAWTAETLEDAKQMACDFAESVS